MKDYRELNRHLEAQGKLAMSPGVRRDLKRRQLLAHGGRGTEKGQAQGRDVAAFVRALLGR